MGFDIFLLVLEPEQPVYIPGQAVQGYLKVVAQEEVACRNIKITIKGHSKVHWSEKSGKNRRHYRAEEQYFRQPVTVWDGANSNNAMQPCNRKFLFNFILPHDIPSSFISHIGRVIYQVKAEADRPWTLDQSHKVFFSVNFMYDLNTDHLAVRPIRLQDEKTVCCLCCSQGPIDLNMRCARSGYVPGESIVVDGEVVNHSGGNIMYTEIKLVQMIKYITTSKNRKEERTVQRVYHPQVDGGARDLWASVPLPIPAVPASHLKHCNIITIDYTFVLMAKLGTCMKAKITAPIIIGSVPLRNTYSTFLPHPVRAGGTTLATAIPSPASGRVSPYRPSAPAHPIPPVPAHAPYSLPPPSYNETFLPEEYSEVPPPSYASCVFGGARGDEAAEDSDDGGFAPRYITYRTNT